jgi:hypothetical protein
MSHVRTQIRDDIATRLTGLATTGNRVHQSRIPPRGDADLPCLLITTNDEEIEQSLIGGLFQRHLELVVIGVAKANSAIDDTLDAIALDVETTMAGDRRASLMRIETDFDDELDRPVGRIALHYRVFYSTRAGDPGHPA